jgi:hypothetical protein
MYCGGGHLGCPIGIKNIEFVEDLPMIIPGQFGFNTAIYRLTLDPMGKCSNAFFSGTTDIIKAKQCMYGRWTDLYKLYVFYSDMKFKMAATAGLSLTLYPMGKMFQNASSLKPLSSRHFEFHIGTKNVQFVEDHLMNIHVQFGFDHICSF